MRFIEIEPIKICFKENMVKFFNEQFQFEYPVTNLDNLRDNLSEVTEDVTFIIPSSGITKICSVPYAYKVLMVIGSASSENPHIDVKFKHDKEM